MIKKDVVLVLNDGTEVHEDITVEALFLSDKEILIATQLLLNKKFEEDRLFLLHGGQIINIGFIVHVYIQVK